MKRIFRSVWFIRPTVTVRLIMQPSIRRGSRYSISIRVFIRITTLRSTILKGLTLQRKAGRNYAVQVIRNVAGMERPLTFRESGSRDQAGRGGRRMKVTLGIMPDFAGTEKKGLRVDGVTKDGPADKGRNEEG